jgi:hypothetical protein
MRKILIILPLLPLVLVLPALVSAGVTSDEPCAWVMWVVYERIGVGDSKYEREIVPEAAYPPTGYTRCVEEMQTLATPKAHSSRDQINVKTAEYSEIIGDRHRVIIELKSGGTLWTTYMCFPHPVKPE